MRVLANENVPGAAVQAMRQAGHDILWIREAHPGFADARILSLAVAESRVLITFDKDLGELAFKSRLPATCGINFFRIHKRSPPFVAQRIVAVLSQRSDWAGHFSVVEDDRIRMTPLVGGSA